MSEKKATLFDLARMCENTDDCHKCPLHGGDITKCNAQLSSTSEDKVQKINDAVIKWIEEHPVKTYADDFFSKFPNAPKESNGYPSACRANIYGDFKCDCDCTKCWNEEMPDEK